jgi:hypothetical protein
MNFLGVSGGRQRDGLTRNLHRALIEYSSANTGVETT